MFCKIVHTHCLVWQLLMIGVKKKIKIKKKKVVFYVFVFGVSLTFNTTQHNMGLVTLVKKS